MTTRRAKAEERKDHIDEMFARWTNCRPSATVDAVFGQPVQTGDKIVIPIASVSYGFGLGFGEARAKRPRGRRRQRAEAAAAGVIARPLGLVEITPEQHARRADCNEQTVGLAGMLLGAWSVFWIARAVIRILGRSRRDECCVKCE